MQKVVPICEWTCDTLCKYRKQTSYCTLCIWNIIQLCECVGDVYSERLRKVLVTVFAAERTFNGVNAHVTF